MKEFITCIHNLGGMAQYAQVMVSNIAHQLGRHLVSTNRAVPKEQISHSDWLPSLPLSSSNRALDLSSTALSPSHWATV